MSALLVGLDLLKKAIEKRYLKGKKRLLLISTFDTEVGDQSVIQSAIACRYRCLKQCRNAIKHQLVDSMHRRIVVLLALQMQARSLTGLSLWCKKFPSPGACGVVVCILSL